MTQKLSVFAWEKKRTTITTILSKIKKVKTQSVLPHFPKPTPFDRGIKTGRDFLKNFMPVEFNSNDGIVFFNIL